MEDARYFREKGRQCRRLVKNLLDVAASDALEAMAKDFDAKADALEAKAGQAASSDPPLPGE